VPQTIAASDPRLRWSGIISTDATPNSVIPWRIPHDEKSLYAEELVGRAAMPAGVRVSFRSNTDYLEGACNAFPERSPIDLVIDGILVGTAPTEDLTSFKFEGLGSRMKAFDLWLPQFGEFQLNGLEISDGAELTAASDPELPKWITYGSSITHCRAADSPTLTWPSIVARTREYDLTCLGFGGQCHLDPLIARVIRDRDADLISLCVGINIYGNESLNARTFGPGIIGFVKIIREKHPDTPIALLSPIYSPGREDTSNAVGFTLRSMREEVAIAVEKLRANGDGNIHYINGLDVFDSNNAHLLPDDLHPNSEGYGIMAANLLGLLPSV
jgi:hypothetical protein